MAPLTTKFKSASQDWETPSSLFKPLNDEFRFTLDAAATEANAKAAKWFSASENGLAQDWGKEHVWLNPPYGDQGARISAWVKKSYDASLRGALVVMLIPARTNTEWFHRYCLGHGEVRFVRGRPKFIGATHGLPQPLCLVIFRPSGDSLMPINGSSRAPLPIGQVQGLNGTGACILSEVKVNDKVLGMQNISTLSMESSSFEATVTVAGQIQQTSASNLSANQYWAYIAVQS